MSQLPVATWALELKPSEKTTYKLHNSTDLKITNAALDPILADENARSTVVLHINNDPPESEDETEDDEKESEDAQVPPQRLVLTSLTPGKIESSIHDTIITRPALVTFEVIGKNVIHLSGYLYMLSDDQSDSDEDSDEDDAYGVDFDDEEDSEEDYSDEDLDMLEEPEFMQDDSHRFEEITDEKTVEIGMKRPRDSDEPDLNSNTKLSKKEKKKLKAQQAAAAEPIDAPPSKKLRKENGESVPVKSTSQDQAESSGKKKDKKEKHDSTERKEKAPKAASKPNAAKDEKKGEKKQDAGQTKVHENGLHVTDAKIGTGPAAKKGSRLEIRYIGKLADGKVFDQNVKGKPLRLTLGKGEVIKGWDQGIVGMKEGGERILIIPPKLGYGAQKSGPIPPNSTLTFELKLLRVF